MYLVMLCFFFISIPNHKAYVANGWLTFAPGYESKPTSLWVRRVRLWRSPWRTRGGILTQMAPRLSNLKVSRLDLRPDVVEKSGFVAILPAFCPLPDRFLPASCPLRACFPARSAKVTGPHRRSRRNSPSPTAPSHDVTTLQTIATHPHKDAQTSTLRHVMRL
ncbi:exported hypothetical protein [Burkholderia cepacia]